MGNLVSRISSPRLLAKMRPWTPADRNAEIDASLAALREVYQTRIEGMEISKACEGIMDILGDVSVTILPFSAVG